MRFADDGGEEAGGADGLVAGERIDLKLEVLRHEFAHDDWTTQKCCGEHAIAEVGRESAGARNHALGKIGAACAGAPGVGLAAGAAGLTASLMSTRQ